MRQLALAARQPAADLAQRVRPAQLAEQHGDELAPAGEAARVPLGLRRHDGLLKLGARKKLEQLTEDAAESGHRGRPPSDVVNFGEVRHIIRRSQRPLRSFSPTLIWTRVITNRDFPLPMCLPLQITDCRLSIGSYATAGAPKCC